MRFPWTRRREERAAERQAFLTALTAIRDTAVAQSAAVEKIADTLNAYLQLLKVEGTPDRQALSEFDEVLLDHEKQRQEAEALRARGYPVDLPLDQQVKWVAEQMDFAL